MRSQSLTPDGTPLVGKDGEPAMKTKFIIPKHMSRRDGYGETDLVQLQVPSRGGYTADGNPIPTGTMVDVPGLFVFREYRPWTMARLRKVRSDLFSMRDTHWRRYNRVEILVDGEKSPIWTNPGAPEDERVQKLDRIGRPMFERYDWPENYTFFPRGIGLREGGGGTSAKTKPRNPKKQKIPDPAAPDTTRWETDAEFEARAYEVVYQRDEFGKFILDEDGNQKPVMVKIFDPKDPAREISVVKKQPKAIVREYIGVEQFNYEIQQMEDELVTLDEKIRVRNEAIAEARTNFTFDGNDWPEYLAWENEQLPKLETQARTLQRRVFQQHIHEEANAQKRSQYKEKYEAVLAAGAAKRARFAAAQQPPPGAGDGDMDVSVSLGTATVAVM